MQQKRFLRELLARLTAHAVQRHVPIHVDDVFIAHVQIELFDRPRAVCFG